MATAASASRFASRRMRARTPADRPDRATFSRVRQPPTRRRPPRWSRSPARSSRQRRVRAWTASPSSQPVAQALQALLDPVAVGRHGLGGGRRRRGPKIGDQVADGNIRLVAHPRHHWHGTQCDRPGNRLLIEPPQVLDRAAAPRHDDYVHIALGQRLDGRGDLFPDPPPLHPRAAHQQAQPGRPAGDDRHDVPQRPEPLRDATPPWRAAVTDSPRPAGPRTPAGARQSCPHRRSASTSQAMAAENPVAGRQASRHRSAGACGNRNSPQSSPCTMCRRDLESGRMEGEPRAQRLE